LGKLGLTTTIRVIRPFEPFALFFPQLTIAIYPSGCYIDPDRVLLACNQEGKVMFTRKCLCKDRLKLAIFMARTVVLAVLCSGCQRTLLIEPVSQAPEGKFLFVESWVTWDGTGHIPGGFIDGPGYYFDHTLKELKTDYIRNNPPSNSFLGILGQGTSRQGSAGGGVGSGLTAMPTLPYTTTIEAATGQLIHISSNHRYFSFPEIVTLPVDMLAVSAEGTLEVSVAGETRILGEGKCWSQEVDIVLRNNEFDGIFQITSTLCNYGWLDRSMIHR
jgi:hypothetical protein